MEKKEMTKFVAFSSQKGGVGKTTFTAITASLLHYRLGYNVAVIDCDYPQHSLIQMRERDLKATMQNEVFKKLAHRQFTTINKKAYPVLQCKADEAPGLATKFLQGSSIPVDVVFFDLPGTVNTPGVLSTLTKMHHILSPISADRVVLESTLAFLDVLNNVLRHGGKTSIESIRLFWNQVDAREKSPLYAAYYDAAAQLGLTVMKSQIADTKRFRKEGELQARTVFRSTILAPDIKLMKSCGLDSFIEEFKFSLGI